jgi:2-iminoacetate synthase
MMILNKTVARSQQLEYVSAENDKLSFVSDEVLEQELTVSKAPDRKEFERILNKSLQIQTLSVPELASLIKIEDPAWWQEMFETAATIKTKVYDHRIVMFAPLYCSNHCINNCLYCGFRRDNQLLKRKQLTREEVQQEAEYLAGTIGHKRLIMVFGEHPSSDIDYIIDSMEAVYEVQAKTKLGTGSIRRVNINAAPMTVEDLQRLNKAGIGTFQVFQETYHQATY